MSNKVPEKYRDLLEKKALGVLVTIMPDGTPQATPVWFDTTGDDQINVNSAKGRQKDKNLRINPNVALTIIDPDNPYRYLEIRGRVTDITEEGASNHINRLASKYLGVDKYPYAQPGEVRVIYRIKPDKFAAWG